MVAGWNPFFFRKHRFHILHFPNSTGLFTKPTGRHYTKHRFSPDIASGRCGGHMYQHLASGIRKRIKHKNKKVTLHMLTHCTMLGCGLTSMVVCIDDIFHDIRERNVTIRMEIWTTKMYFLGFWDIPECDIMEVDITKFRVYIVI